MPNKMYNVNRSAAYLNCSIQCAERAQERGKHIENPVFDHYRGKLRHVIIRRRVYRVGGGGIDTPVCRKDTYLQEGSIV